MKRRQTLLRKVQVLFALVLLGFGVLTSLSVWLLARNAVRQQVRQDIQIASRFLHQFLEQRRARLDLQTRLIADQPSLRAICADAGAMKHPETLIDRLDYYKKMTGSDGIVFYDREGKPFQKLGYTPKSVKTIDVDSMMFLRPAAEGMNRGLEGCPDGFLLTSTAPITVGVQVVGAVTVYGLIGHETAQMMAENLGIQVSFQINDGTQVTSFGATKDLAHDGGFHQTTIRGRSFGYQSFDVMTQDSEQVITAAALRPEDESTKPYRTFTQVFYVLLVAAIVAALLVATHFAKGVTRPLAKVVEAATVLQAGEWPDELEVTAKDEVGLLQSVFNDTVASLRRAQDRLLTMLETDPLTELPNHRKFKEALAREADSALHQGRLFSVLLIDIDHFKRLNETQGMDAGDKLICELCRVIKLVLPAHALVARFGGEEFAVLLPQYDLESASTAAEKLRHTVEVSDLGVTVSIGCAQFGVNTSQAEGMSIAAELALARAKQLGRNRVCQFDSVPGAHSDADPYQLYRYMQDASLATIQALAAAVDAKDPYTEGHSRRVAEYAKELAEYIGMAQADLDLVYRTGTLHDVGKIGVPDSILKKPAKLNEDERAIMETHPVLGELIVRKAPQLEDTIPGVRHHHEAWDGSGYPDNLKGESIPFVARLLAIADAYDAMTSNRPYRQGMSQEAALQEILKKAGTQFEPDLAQAFVRLMTERRQRAA